MVGTQKPPRQAAPATPPKEGNGLALQLVQIQGNHPVRLRLPPLHRRGIDGCRHYKMHRPDTPPQERNGLAL